MCQPASFVLTKEKVFWSLKTDSHTEIIAEHELHEDGARGVNLLKVEITPPNDEWDLPLNQWAFRIDQDILPAWHDAEHDEARSRKALVDWAAQRLFIDGRDVVVASKTCAICYRSTVRACDSSTVRACDSSTVTAYGSSTVRAYDSSTVRACDSSTVTAYGSSTVTAYDSSTVRACDSSTVTACENRSTVRHYSKTEPAKPTGPHAVVIDSRGVQSIPIVGE